VQRANAGGQLFVHVFQAKGLKFLNPSEDPDAWCCACELQSSDELVSRVETQTQYGLNPEWNQAWMIEGVLPGDLLMFKVTNHGTKASETEWKFNLAVENIPFSGKLKISQQGAPELEVDVAWENTPCLPAEEAVAKVDASALLKPKTPQQEELAVVLDQLTKAPFLGCVKSMTTDLDKVMQDLIKEFVDQEALRDQIQALADRYRPLRQQAVSIAVYVKNIADDAENVLITVLKCAMDESDIESVRGTIKDMVDGWKRVAELLSDLRAQHDVIHQEASDLSLQASAKAELRTGDVTTTEKKQIGAAIGGAAGTARMVAGGVLCVASGPVGWFCLAGGAAVAVGAGGAAAYNSKVLACQKELEKSAHKINAQMMLVTAKLEKECAYLKELVCKLESSATSTEKAQDLVEKWSDEGRKEELQYWLDETLPKEMAGLSEACEKYLGDEFEVPKIVDKVKELEDA